MRNSNHSQSLQELQPGQGCLSSLADPVGGDKKKYWPVLGITIAQQHKVNPSELLGKNSESAS